MQVGKRGRRHLAGGPTFVRKFLLSLYLACIMVIMHGTFLSMQWFPESQIRAGLVEPTGRPSRGPWRFPRGPSPVRNTRLS